MFGVTDSSGSAHQDSIFEILPAGGAAGIASQEAKHEDPEEEEDDRINGDLEGEHGDRPASGTAPSSYGAMFGRHDAEPSSGAAIGVDLNVSQSCVP